LNKNTNGLLRQYFPKSSDFELAGQAEVKRALKRLNTPPRKDLNVNTPAQLMGEYMVKNHSLTYDAHESSIHAKYNEFTSTFVVHNNRVGEELPVIFAGIK